MAELLDRTYDVERVEEVRGETAGIGPTLVVGGTGKTGRRVAERLQGQGRRVRAVSRGTQPGFDWEDPADWHEVLGGVKSVYLTFAPDIAVPGAVDKVALFVDAARRQGVERIVLLSGRGEDEAMRAEEIVQRSGLESTVLRCSWFAQNFSESYFIEGILAGHLRLPAGSVGEPFLDAEDIAEIAVAALTTNDHVGQLLELTGPRLLTFADAVSEISVATGRTIQYEEVSPEAFAQSLASVGVPGDVIWLLDYLFTTVLDGRNASVTSDVERVLGRPAGDFSAYARASAEAGAWD